MWLTTMGAIMGEEREGEERGGEGRWKGRHPSTLFDQGGQNPGYAVVGWLKEGNNFFQFSLFIFLETFSVRKKMKENFQ